MNVRNPATLFQKRNNCTAPQDDGVSEETGQGPILVPGIGSCNDKKDDKTALRDRNQIDEVPQRQFMQAMNVDDSTPRPCPSIYEEISTRASKLYDEYWGWEVLTWLFSATSFVIVIILLAASVDNKRAWDKDFKFSLNSVIAILFSFVKGSMLMTVTECIGQFRFLGGVKLDALVLDIETYDLASRGMLGAICLFFKPRAVRLSLLGAAIMIAALAIDPFVQQLVEHSNRNIAQVYDDSMAKLRYAMNFEHRSEELSRAIDTLTRNLQMPQAIHAREFKEDAIKYACATGNCTWPEYLTLGTYFDCRNDTSFLKGGCQIMDESANGKVSSPMCNYTLPNGHELRSPPVSENDLVRLEQYLWNTSIIKPGRKVYNHQGTTDPDILAFSIIKLRSARYLRHKYDDYDVVEAWECSLRLSLQHRRASYLYGVLSDHLIYESFSQLDCTSSFAPKKIPYATNPYCILQSQDPLSRFENDSLSNGDAYTATYFSESCYPACDGYKWRRSRIPKPVLRQFRKNCEDLLWTRRFKCAALISRESMNSLKLDLESSVDGYGYLGVTESSDGSAKAVYNNSTHIFSRVPLDGMKQVMEDLSRGTSVAIRNLDDYVEFLHGTAWISEPYVRIIWPWLILPASLLLLTLGFLISTIHSTKVSGMKPWKSSSLPLLLEGLEFPTDPDEAPDVASIERVAEDTPAKRLGFWSKLRGRPKGRQEANCTS